MKPLIPLEILLVEDNDFDARVLIGLLAKSQRYRIAITRAASLGAALIRIEDTYFDLIVTDLELPDSEGAEAVRRLDEAVAEAPIIVATGHGEESLIEQSLSAGAQDFIVKGSTDPIGLDKAIHHALERHRVRREHQHAIAQLEKATRRYKKTLGQLKQNNLLLAGEIEQRRAAERLLKESEESLNLAQSVARIGSWELDIIQQRFTISQSMRRVLDIPDELDIKETFAWFMEHVHPEDRPIVEQATGSLQSTGSFAPHEYRMLDADGQCRWIFAGSPVPKHQGAGGQPDKLLGVIQDITARRAAEERAARLARLYYILSQTNEAIVRISDEGCLLQSICDIAIRLGGFNLAWIGLYDEKRDALVAAAAAGDLGAAVKDLVLPLGPSAGRGHALSCEAFRAKAPLISNDYWQDARGDLREAVPQLSEVAAGMSLPLWCDDEIIGVYALDSRHQGFFDEETAGLLKDMALNISYGLNNLRRARVLRETVTTLTESEEKHRRLVENLGKDYFFYRHDMSGAISYISPSITEMLGYATAECYEHYSQQMTSSPLNADVERFTQLSMQGIPQRPYEIEVYHKDGRRKLLEVTESPVRDAGGEVIVVEGLAHDITERKSIEEALRQAKTQLENLFNESDEGICLIDLDHKIHLANDKLVSLLQASRDELLSRPCYETFRCGLQSVDACCIQSVVAHDKEYVLDYEVKVAGKRKPLSLRAKPMHDSSGRVTAIMKYVRDVTEYEDRQRQELQAQKLESIGQLAAGIAHEINTPAQYVGDNTTFLKRAFTNLLEVLKAYGTAIEEAGQGALPAERAAEVAEVVRKAKLDYLMAQVPQALDQSLEGLGRIASIVGAMKEFSHPSDGEKQPVDLNKGIENTILVSRNEWKYVAEVVTELDPALVDVPCLRDELNQVFLNIIINAAHAIAAVLPERNQEKGCITVRTAMADGYAEISFSDDGSGIPEAILGKIFDPFFTTKPVGKGTGQGLAIAHSIIVDKHGGSITVESELGKGTTFLIRLPLEEAVPQGEECRLEDSIR